MKLVYPAIFTPFQDSPGFTVTIPDLPGCVTEGNSLVEAIEMGEDAASGWILDEMEDGNSYPPSREFQSINCPEGSIINILLLDKDAYSEKYSDKTIRKNVTIPAWLNTYGEKNGLNFSKVLQDSLISLAKNK